MHWTEATPLQQRSLSPLLTSRRRPWAQQTKNSADITWQLEISPLTPGAGNSPRGYWWHQKSMKPWISGGTHGGYDVSSLVANCKNHVSLNICQRMIRAGCPRIGYLLILHHILTCSKIDVALVASLTTVTGVFLVLCNWACHIPSQFQYSQDQIHHTRPRPIGRWYIAAETRCLIMRDRPTTKCIHPMLLEAPW